MTALAGATELGGGLLTAAGAPPAGPLAADARVLSPRL